MNPAHLLPSEVAAPLANDDRAKTTPDCTLTPPVRHDAPETSRLAAQAVATRSAQQRATILVAIIGTGALGATDAELEVATGLRAQSVSPRRGELETLGLIAWNGKRRNTPRGCPAMVWVAMDVAPQAGKGVTP
jgi:CRP-like cAMP-binding protein